jgi:ATP-dependent DNA helicase RecQ
MISQQDFQELKFKTLKHFWGYDGFRDSQEEIIDSVINEKDTLVLCLQEPENLFVISFLLC